MNYGNEYLYFLCLHSFPAFQILKIIPEADCIWIVSRHIEHASLHLDHCSEYSSLKIACWNLIIQLSHQVDCTDYLVDIFIIYSDAIHSSGNEYSYRLIEYSYWYLDCLVDIFSRIYSDVIHSIGNEYSYEFIEYSYWYLDCFVNIFRWHSDTVHTVRVAIAALGSWQVSCLL